MKRILRLGAVLAAPISAVLCVASAANEKSKKAGGVVIEYVQPIDKAHKPLYDLLKEHQALERVRKLLIPIRWPRTLRLELKGCEGESNAWYEDAVVTVCYEHLDDMWRSANSSKRPSTISLEDAFIGPFVDTFLHETGHGIFDLFKIPILGREEDAADQLAAYFVLQFPKETKRRLILGGAYSYASELKVRSARDLYRRRLDVGRHITFADEHGTPAQRLFNLLCIAYGSDKELFGDLVEKGYLPEERAKTCEDEYQQIDYAYHQLIGRHVKGRIKAPAKAQYRR
jgi:Putative metallopeptidase